MHSVMLMSFLGGGAELNEHMEECFIYVHVCNSGNLLSCRNKAGLVK